MEVDLHLPDLDFVKHTNERFHVNRGIYNTIDAWFYQKGLVNILERRRHIFKFLAYSHEQAQKKGINKRLFYPNGLTTTLEEYLVKSKFKQSNLQKLNYTAGLLDN